MIPKLRPSIAFRSHDDWNVLNGLNDWNNGSGLRLFNVLGKTKAVGDAERFNLNVAMTNNVLAATRLAGVKKIVCGSSLAIYGLYYPVTALQPDSAGRRRSSATPARSLRTFQARR